MRLFRCLLVALLALMLFSGKSAAQEESSCDDVLLRARESFDGGHLYGIPALLKPCLDNGFSKSQRIQAYWLLTRTYLLIDDPISAEDSYLKLLKLDPEYYIDSDRDPVEMVYLNEKFTTTPIFVLYGRIGLNLSSVSEIHNFGVDNTNLSKESYESKIGFQVGGGAELNFSDNLSFGLELLFKRTGYTYKNSLFNNDQQSFTESQTWLSIPLFIKYRWEFNKIRPFVYLGLSNDFLINANGSARLVDRVNSDSEGIAEFAVTGPDINVTDQRNRYNRSGLIGFGANYRQGYNYWFVDIRYDVGLTNFVNSNTQYGESELLYKYGYVDDYKRLNNFSFSIGYVIPLYKPRKIGSGKGIFKKLLNTN